MAKQQEAACRCAKEGCSCDKCWKPDPENEKKAAKWWRELYKKHGWPKDDYGYL